MESTTETSTAKADLFGIITNKIIEHLEKGTVPWRKPWKDSGMPQNIISKQYYRGINVLLLGMHQYEHNLFLSFKQVKDVGGKIKKGEKGHMVVYWKSKDAGDSTDDNSKESEQQSKPVLRYYYVFNISQCENLPETFVLPEREAHDIPSCDAVVKNMPKCPPIQHKEQQAYYNFKNDFVNMPKKKSFKSDEAYYSTLFHELMHSTGHASRLNRDTIVQMVEFGGEMYSKEELVAEIGTCYLQSYVGITDQFMPSVAYIQAWLAKLRNDKRFIFSAATAAQRAANYILNVSSSDEEVNKG